MLKEVIEDLEWPSAGAGSAAAQRGSVEVSMWAPRHERLALSAMGEGGALTVRARLGRVRVRVRVRVELNRVTSTG
jgi:hypothetical protein